MVVGNGRAFGVRPTGAETVYFFDQYRWVGEAVVARPVPASPVTHQDQRRVLAEVGAEAAQALEGFGDGVGGAGQPAPARPLLEALA